jgi:prepilin-type N-terminal cleavage/methylation domain-containing protein
MKCGKMKRVRLNSQARKAFQGSSRGFTLIEVLIAIALMGIIAVAVLGALSTASAALMTADKRATAESLARSQMEYVKNQGYKDASGPAWQVTYDRVSGIPAGYSICSVNWTTNQTANCGNTSNMSIIAIALNSTTGDSGLQKIKLVIERDGTEIITLEGYKRRAGG